MEPRSLLLNSRSLRLVTIRWSGGGPVALGRSGKAGAAPSSSGLPGGVLNGEDLSREL
jgi:hypothetical protein